VGGVTVYPAINPGSRTERAVAVLAELIMSGRLVAGDFLPSEAELCKQLGLSRPTVRMALRTLETRGLVVTKHGVGVQVTDRTRQAVTDSIELMLLRQGAGPRDMLEVRLMLECQGASLAAQRATDDNIDAIARSIASMRGAQTIAETVETDLDFHVRVAEGSQNEVLVALVHAMRGLLRDTIAATYAIDRSTEERIDAHGRVLTSIVARDAVAAETAMREHLCRTEMLLTHPVPGAMDGEHAEEVQR
jgi:GntR family transcriptional repressor for pyruvate dehydrogenase complex